MRRGTKVLSMVVLAVLIAVNLVLLFLLLRPHGAMTAQLVDQVGRNDLTLPAPPATGQHLPASAEPTASADPGDAKDSTRSAQQIDPAPAERLLLATSSKEAWRATVGDCESPGKIERSSNGGASWERIAQTSSGPIVRLGAEGSGNIFAVGGAGHSCKVPYMAYLNDRAVTSKTIRLNDVWFPTPTDPDEVNGPDDNKGRPCQQHAVGLAPLDLSRALIVCINGAVLSTSDSGKTWQEVMRFPNTLAVATGGGRYWLAGRANGCSGIAVRSLNVQSGTSSIASTSCAPVDQIATGPIAIDVSGNAIWVWVGSQVEISSDEGRTWA